MSVVSVRARSFILALFIRDDGERFLLGDNGYDFKDSQLHFAANTIENDEVQKQGADGVMVAGQVRRASVQSFDGFVGDATMPKEIIEQMRRDFFAFFVKGHHFRVVYVDCNRNAWQRKGGYLVDAPEVKELWQIHPEYHVGLNFEDVNYYSYDEDADGNEILANLVNVPVSTEAEGGLVWDEDGAVSEDAEVEYDTETAEASGKAIAISDAAEAPLASFQLDGETSQNGTPTPSAPVAVNTTTGENVVQICGKNLFDKNADNIMNAYIDPATTTITSNDLNRLIWIPCSPNTTYTISAMASNWRRVVAWTEKEPAVGVQSYGIVNTMLNNVTTVSITTGATAKYIIFRLWHQNNSTETLQQALDNLQIELGSTARTYEPYQGQSYEVNLGKNLINFDSFQQSWDGASVGGEGTTITMSPNTSGSMGLLYDSTTYSVSIPAGRTITWSRTWAGGGTWESGTITFPLKLTYADGTTETLSFGDTTENNYGRVLSATKTLPKTVVSVKIESGGCFGITNLSAPTSFNLQLEYGTATSYAPYFTPIELCKIGDYQDYIYKSGDKWYVHSEIAKYTFDGSENWTSRQGNDVGLYHLVISEAILLPASTSAITQAISSHFVPQTNDYVWSSNGHPCFSAVNNSNPCVLRFSKGEATNDLAAWKTWLGSNNVSLYAILATATDTEITNATLITQLNALLTTARTYAGTNNITTITPNEQGTLEIGYYTKYQPMVGSGGYVWEAGGAGGPTVIMNNSIDSVSPVWTIYGPTTNPQLENATTGETIEYVGTIAQGQTLIIDMGEQTASLDGLNVISNLVGDFIQLAPGRNNIIYSVSGEAGASELGWSEIVG